MTIFLKFILASIMWHGIVYALWVLNDALIMLSFIFPMVVLNQCNLLNQKNPLGDCGYYMQLIFVSRTLCTSLKMAMCLANVILFIFMP